LYYTTLFLTKQLFYTTVAQTLPFGCFSKKSPKNKPYLLVAQTLPFGCPNPTFWLPKPYLLVAQTLPFGCF